MSIFQIIHKQTYLGQQIRNVYWYDDSPQPGDAADLADTFNTNVIPSIRDVQNDALTHIELEVNNVDDLTDFTIFDLGGIAGTVTGTGAPPFIATQIKLVRATRAVRNGFKRYAGVAAGLVDEDDIVGTTVYTALQTLATVLQSSLASALPAQYDPVIVRRTVDPATGVVSYTAFEMDTAIADPYLTTQSSRKRGVGL